MCMQLTADEYAKTKSKKKGKDPKITQTKNRVKHVDSVKNYFKVGGPLHMKLKELIFHLFHHKWLSLNHSIGMYKGFVGDNPGKAICVMSDHSLDFSPRLDGQYQSEYFGDHPSIQMEGHAVEFALPSNGMSALAKAVQDRTRLVLDNSAKNAHSQGEN